MVGRSAGIASAQVGSATDAATEHACSRPGRTASRSAITRGRSTLYQFTVDYDGVGVFGDESPNPVIEHLAPERCLASHAGQDANAGEVIIDLADHLVGKAVSQDRSSTAAVERAGVFGQKGCLLDGTEPTDVNHDRYLRRRVPAPRRIANEWPFSIVKLVRDGQ
jgi:hypothetical protein